MVSHTSSVVVKLWLRATVDEISSVHSKVWDGNEDNSLEHIEVQ